nr:synaptobrevin, longin-like domain protein [Tanacetum cinerariifolium]
MQSRSTRCFDAKCKDYSNTITSLKLVLLVLIEAQHHISNDSPLLGVNTPRCDEDRLIITTVSYPLMLFGLTKDVVLLMLLGHKKTNDVVKLQALINRKKVVIIEDTIRQALRLDDDNGVDCLSNEEIFAELARMGYEKPFLKLTFYKAFFSAQWKFLIHTIGQCMSAKRTTWNEFSSSMASAVICLAIGRKFNFSKYIFDSMKVFANMRRIGKGFTGVDTPLFDTMLVQPQVQDATEVEEDKDDNEVPAAPSPPSPTLESLPPLQEHIPSPPQAQPAPPSSLPQQQPTQTINTSESLMTLLYTLMETCATLAQKVANLEQDKVPHALEIVKLKQRVRKLEKKRRSKPSGLKRLKKVGGKITELDVDEDVTLVDVDTAVGMDVDTQRRMKEDVTAVKEVTAAEPTVFDDKEMQEKHLDNIKKYQSLKRKPISVARARNNMIVYLKNMVGYKIQHFKGMTYDQVRPIFKREYNHVQTFLKSDRDEEPTKKRYAKEALLQESFKKLRAEVEVLGPSSTQQDTLTADPTEISE